MRVLHTLMLGAALALPAAAVPAMAQTTHSTHATPHRAMPHKAKPMAARTGTPDRPTENDKGPFTPEANAAYMGGGAVMTQPAGAAPAPMAPMR